MTGTLLPHKQALYEILDAEISPLDGDLHDIAEGVLLTAVDRLPASCKWVDFIVLGDFEAEDVKLGWNTERARMFRQAIHSLSIFSSSVPEYEAEYKCDRMARIVRKILKANQNLVSTSYPTGIAIESRLYSSKSEFVQIWELPACMQTIIIDLKVQESENG